ncbi:MAG: hypothetical protein HY912_13865 [Desulfomonile tiedjei]|uniref:Uncharacterized protein n=1 Tax=Desulfomonile tiedjei TaxID=2358 RepID=A0A9D6Z4I3_9BACT|nr:hypothetical protein [Desulfomonile tiedjei]
MRSAIWSRISNLEPKAVILVLITITLFCASVLIGPVLGWTKIAVDVAVGAIGIAAVGCILIIFQSVRKSRFF